MIVEEASSGASSQHQITENDEEMSDADSEGEEDGEENGTETETPQETSQEAAAREEHISELERRREEAINRRIISAWESGLSLPPEIEQYLKEQSERGTLSVSMDIRGVLNRTSSGYGPLVHPSSSTTSTVAPRAAA